MGDDDYADDDYGRFGSRHPFRAGSFRERAGLPCPRAAWCHRSCCAAAGLLALGAAALLFLACAVLAWLPVAASSRWARALRRGSPAVVRRAGRGAVASPFRRRAPGRSAPRSTGASGTSRTSWTTRSSCWTDARRKRLSCQPRHSAAKASVALARCLARQLGGEEETLLDASKRLANDG